MITEFSFLVELRLICATLNFMKPYNTIYRAKYKFFMSHLSLTVPVLVQFRYNENSS